jgi:hypothetical protein
VRRAGDHWVRGGGCDGAAGWAVGDSWCARCDGLEMLRKIGQTGSQMQLTISSVE